MGKVMQTLETQIKEMIAPILKDYGVRLVCVNISAETLQILLEPAHAASGVKASVTLDQCAEISREISVLLDVEDVMPHAYNLQVSSAGINRPLLDAEDFKRFEKERVKVKTSEPIVGQTKFVGDLVASDAQKIVVEMQGEQYEIPADCIKEACLDPVLKF